MRVCRLRYQVAVARIADESSFCPCIAIFTPTDLTPCIYICSNPRLRLEDIGGCAPITYSTSRTMLQSFMPGWKPTAVISCAIRDYASLFLGRWYSMSSVMGSSWRLRKQIRMSEHQAALDRMPFHEKDQPQYCAFLPYGKYNTPFQSYVVADIRLFDSQARACPTPTGRVSAPSASLHFGP